MFYTIPTSSYLAFHKKSDLLKYFLLALFQCRVVYSRYRCVELRATAKPLRCGPASLRLCGGKPPSASVKHIPGTMLELHIWGPAFSLPSIDPQCNAAVAYLNIALQRDQWTIIASSNPLLSPTRM